MKIKSQLLIILFLITISGYTQVQNNGNLRMLNGASVGVFGDFTNNGTFTNNTGTLHVAGSNAQTFDGTSLIHTNNITINKASNSLQLDNELQVSGVLTFTSGKILSDRADTATEFVHFLDGSSYTGESNTNHIDGVVRKTGNDSFVFPIGDNNLLRTISISAPSNVSDQFTSFYAAVNPDSLYNRSSLELGLDHVSGCEYWILNRTGGSSSVEVNLSWASNSCEVDNLCDLRVARWDGTKWTSEGNGGVTGSVSAGSVISGTTCTTPVAVANFSPFTLGSSSSNNPLPIELISFHAKICGNKTCLSWETASEINNDFFTIEKSKDTYNWEEVTTIEGAGNSSVTLNYSTTDDLPFSGVSYYRLKQTDFNGKYSYSEIRTVNFNGLGGMALHIYPNPANHQITLTGKSSEVNSFKIYNNIGQDVSSIVQKTHINESKIQLNISLLPTGVYTIKTISSSSASRFVKS